MKLTLKRRYNNDRYCIGSLYIDGKYYCDTLEDTDRGLKQQMSLKQIVKKKIKHITAIPAGLYRITIAIISPKYSKKSFFKNFCKGKMPRLVNVPGYEGILIHPGNTEKDTDGCILVGQNKVKGKVINSTDTWVGLYNIMSEADAKGEEIWIEIVSDF